MGPQNLNFSLLSSIDDSLSSFVENDAPPNTPNTSTLEEQLIEEAQKQEVQLKQHLENMAKESEENIQEKPKIMTVQSATNIDTGVRVKVNPENEKQRRHRTREGIDALKTLVPGLNNKSSEIEVFERTVKYIYFMKSKVGPEVDKEFVMKQ